MVEIGAVASDNTNLVSGGAAGASDKVDLSYSPYPGKNSASTTTDITMNFDDFLDMINPLQHIPIVSSVYRAITNENINPIARIAGDTLYGGVMGVASAGLAALGAVGDEAFSALSGGKSASSTVVAFLFGNDAGAPNSDVQLASNEKTTPDVSENEPSSADVPSSAPALMQLAALQTPAPLQSPILQQPDLTVPAAAPIAAPQTAAPVLASATTTPAPTDVASNAVPAALAGATAGAMPAGIPLDRSKLAYGGVMDSAMMQNAQQTQAMALAMAGGAGIMQTQHDLRNNRFATSSKMGAAGVMAANPSAPAVSPNVQANPQTQAALQNLMQELQAGKAINQYKNAAQMSPLPGAAVDVAN